MTRRPDILVVDDDPIVITGLRKLLTDVGKLGTIRFATRIADARKGIEAATPDLVLHDVQLPDGNGLDLCRELAADPRWADVPILVLTSGDRIDDEVAALDAGAVDFLTKPVRPPQVVARVRTHLRLKQLADSLRLAACNDVLTGLANRRHIEENLPRAWSAAMRTGEALSLLLVDVDHFKRYNDHYGHPAGDRCLRAIGAALSEVPKRGTDIVGRYGGEAFLLLLPSTTPSGLAGLAASAGSCFWVDLPLKEVTRKRRSLTMPVMPQRDRLSGLSILVIDDNALNLEVARGMLEREGATVTTLESGAMALAWFAEGGKVCDLVLIDLQMPDLDGFETASRLPAEVPKIAVTAGALDDERKRALAAGMVALVTKPVDPEVLCAACADAVVHELQDASQERPSTGDNEQRAGRSMPSPEAGPDAPALASRSGHAVWPELPGIDSAAARLQTGGDLTLFVKLHERASRAFRELAAMPVPADRAAMKLLAADLHRAQGSAGVIGAHEVKTAAKDAESALLRDTSERVTEALKRFREAVSALSPAAHFETSEAQSLSPETPTAGPDHEVMARLLKRLEARDLDALEDFDMLAPHLRETLGDNGFEALDKAMAALDFERARQLLAEPQATRNSGISGAESRRTEDAPGPRA